MRVQLNGEQSAQTFTNTLLEIGNGTKNIPYSDSIFLMNDFCKAVTSMEELILNVYPDILQNYNNDSWFRERSILAPTNEFVSRINENTLLKKSGVRNLKTGVLYASLRFWVFSPHLVKFFQRTFLNIFENDIPRNNY